MSTITLEPTLQNWLEQIAQATGKSPKDIVNEALGEHLERLSEQQLEAEIQAFEKMYPDLKQKYYGHFIAISAGQVVDMGEDFESLFLRVQARFGNLLVLIRQVGDTPTPEWRF